VVTQRGDLPLRERQRCRAFRATFGELEWSQHYYYSTYARSGLPSPAYDWTGEHYGTVDLRVLPDVETLTTNGARGPGQ